MLDFEIGDKLNFKSFDHVCDLFFLWIVVKTRSHRFIIERMHLKGVGGEKAGGT